MDGVVEEGGGGEEDPMVVDPERVGEALYVNPAGLVKEVVSERGERERQKQVRVQARGCVSLCVSLLVSQGACVSV